MIFDEESASDAQKFLAPPKLVILEINWRQIFPHQKHFKNILSVEEWNVGNRLKRVLAKFRADRSHPRGVNGLSKFVGYGVGLDFHPLHV